MAEPTTKLVINHSLQRAGAVPPSEAAIAAKERNKRTAEDVRKRRKAIHDQALADINGSNKSPDDAADPTPAPPRENIESIEVTLSDGRVVVYGPPNGISLSDRIARLFSGRPLQEGGPDPGISEYRLTRMLMGVRTINGNAVPVMSDLIQRTKLANQLGDEAIDILHHYDRIYWPPLTTAELPAVKKNLRQ